MTPVAQVRECLEHTTAPMDGAGLTEALHARGINVRYLGRVALALRPHPTLAYLHAIALAELVLRAAKHMYTTYLQVPLPLHTCYSSLLINNIKNT